MFSSWPMPCPRCAASVERPAVDSHSCDPGRRREYQHLTARGEALAFETRFRAYLARAEGRFEVWLAARDVRRSR